MQLWRLDPETGEPLERLVEGAENVWRVALAPDASWLAADIGDGQLWVHHTDGSEPKLLAARLNGGPFVSPDGTTLAYLDFRVDEAGAGAQYIELVTPDGTVVGDLPTGRIRAGDGAFVCFSPSGDSITAHLYVGGVTNLWDVPIDGSDWVQLTDFDNGVQGVISDAAWSPDGEWLVLSMGEYWSDVVLIEDFQ